MQAGLYEADLGGGLLKEGIARSGQGKRGGFRTLVATSKSSHWMLVFGFAKNERNTIGKNEEEALKKRAGYLLALTPEAPDRAQQAGELREVQCDAQGQGDPSRSGP